MRKKKKKKKRLRNRSSSQQPEANNDLIFPPAGLSWMEGDGLHALIPAEKPSEAQIQKITEQYQREIRKSPLFKEWVKQFGKQKAAEMLKECRFEVR